MLFSTTVFLFYFLPIVIILYYVMPKKVKNVILLLASLLFYTWGEPIYILLMLTSIVLNYACALIVCSLKKKSVQKAKVMLGVSVALNLIMLGYFKYFNFICENINISVQNIILPIGISFFSFQAMSYVIDCYRGHGAVNKNIVHVALYISFFPQLIAGPIVRYETIADQLKNRKESVSLFASGIRRFIIGLSKKIILANTFAVIADAAFDSVSPISAAMAWLGAIAYTLQIYFDFSGYSDMAIGLGRMFGFEFLENFNYPYISKSITEFWRRWHISLGTWFRDYLYIPLGGNRKGIKRQYINLAIVWLLTGIWHGANWTFILWGVFYGILIMLEKGFLLRYLDKWKIIGNFYTMLCVILGWVLFKADNLEQAYQYVKSMFGFTEAGFIGSDFKLYAENYIGFLILGIFFSMPIGQFISSKMNKLMEHRSLKGYIVCGMSFLIFIMVGIITMATVVSNTYNPFIYFNF